MKRLKIGIVIGIFILVIGMILIRNYPGRAQDNDGAGKVFSEITLCDSSGNGFILTNDVVIDNSDNIYVLGGFNGSASVIANSGMINTSGEEQWRSYIIKLNDAGIVQWTLIFDPKIYGSGMALGPGDGELYVVGEFPKGDIDFDPGETVDSKNGSYDTNAFLTRIDSSGKYKRTKTWNGASASVVACDNDGFIYVGGEITPDPDSLRVSDSGLVIDDKNMTLESRGGSDNLVIKFDSQGDSKWLRVWGGIGDEFATGIAIDKGGAIYIASYTEALYPWAGMKSESGEAGNFPVASVGLFNNDSNKVLNVGQPSWEGERPVLTCSKSDTNQNVYVLSSNPFRISYFDKDRDYSPFWLDELTDVEISVIAGGSGDRAIVCGYREAKDTDDSSSEADRPFFNSRTPFVAYLNQIGEMEPIADWGSKDYFTSVDHASVSADGMIAIIGGRFDSDDITGGQSYLVIIK
ncbi:MAG: hypothetical protein ABIC40_00255 [bacterium]